MDKTTLRCDHCGKEADLEIDPHAWDGWQGRMNALLIDWEHICPDCQKKEIMKDAAERG